MSVRGRDGSAPVRTVTSSGQTVSKSGRTGSETGRNGSNRGKTGRGRAKKPDRFAPWGIQSILDPQPDGPLRFASPPPPLITTEDVTAT